MAGKVYFGNTNFQTSIDAPVTGLKATSSGYSSVTNLLNGRNFVRRSYGSARTFSASWLGSLNSTDLTVSLQTIKDFADGLYGSGNVYWVDPYAATSNIMPPHWAAPMLNETDWPSLSATVTPTFVANTYTNNYPIKRAVYSLGAGHADTKKLTLIIPSTHTLNFGWHATAASVTASSAAGIRIVPYNLTGVAQTAVNPTSILAGDTQRTNQTFDGSTTSRVEIFLANGAASTSVANIVAMIAQILPTGTSVATGGFISGRGTTALQFGSPVEIEYYSANVNNGQAGLSTTLVEVD
jgi:hypothetical protein